MDDRSGGNSRSYNSPLAHWNETASVRVRPWRALGEERGKVYFPPEQVPLLEHPMVSSMGAQIRTRILLERLYWYLDFTTSLEYWAINPVLLQISNRSLGLSFPEEVVLDARKIYVDEGYHAYFSADLKRQLEQATNQPADYGGEPMFLTRLFHVRNRLETRFQVLADVFFAIVSETLISSILGTIPDDERVVTAVRLVVEDHSIDEAQHHAYFARILELIWPQLPRKCQEVIGGLVPDFILMFLEPDTVAIRHLLKSHDFDQKFITEIIEETYSNVAITASAQISSKATIEHFRRVGMLEIPSVAEEFRERGFVI